MKRTLKTAQIVKMCDLIRAKEKGIKEARDPKQSVIALGQTIGLEPCLSNLRLIEECLGVDWILAKRKKSNDYGELCKLYDELDERLTRLERAAQAVGIPR